MHVGRQPEDARAAPAGPRQEPEAALVAAAGSRPLPDRRGRRCPESWFPPPFQHFAAGDSTHAPGNRLPQRGWLDAAKTSQRAFLMLARPASGSTASQPASSASGPVMP
jgi:hypothetical protein